MDTALALLRLSLERGWTLGLLLILFCGGAIASSRYGVDLPDPVKQWSAAGLIFGVCALVVSLTVNLTARLSVELEARRKRSVDRAEEDAEAKQVLANLDVLSPDDAVLLAAILASTTTRF